MQNEKKCAIIYKHLVNRGVAQLVARVVWDHEVAGSIPVTSTIRDRFLRNSKEFQKIVKCRKVHVCKITACAFNFLKFYKILKNTEKISKKFPKLKKFLKNFQKFQE